MRDKRLTTLVLALASLGVAALAAETSAVSLAPGSRGFGLTVLEGTRIDTFGVEILGLQRNASLPGRQQILVRLSGLDLERTGIVAGMSGSPVYVDGELVGAVAYGWRFSEEPLGLLTPIDEMLAVLRRDLSGTGDAVDVVPPSDGTRLGVWLAGGGEGTLSLATRLLSPYGMDPLAAPVGAASEAATPPLRPGAAVAVELVGGDLSLAIIGTVTQVDGNHLVCFGHPLMGGGAVDLPLTGVRIFGVLANQDRSFKLGAATGVVGAARQDRVAAVAGVLGARAPVLPLQVDMGEEATTFTFDVARHPLLTAALCQVALMGALESAFKAMGDASLELDVEVELTDGRHTAWRRAYAGRNALMMAALGLGPPLRALTDPAFADLHVAAVRTRARVRETIRAARIAGARLQRATAAPGATVGVVVRLAPWRGQPSQVTVPVHVPADAAGPLSVRVGSGLRALAWEDERFGAADPPDSDALLHRLGRAGAADELVVELLAPGPGLAIAGRQLPSPPPSVQQLLDEAHAAGVVRHLTDTVVYRQRLGVDYVLEGEHLLTLNVVPEGRR